MVGWVGVCVVGRGVVGRGVVGVVGGVGVVWWGGWGRGGVEEPKQKSGALETARCF